MKKYISLLLIAAIVLSLCSCGITDDDVRGKTKKKRRIKEDSETREEVDTSNNFDDFFIPEEEDTEPEKTEKSIENNTDESYKPNFVYDSTYSNEYFGFEVTLDSDWTFATEEELKEMNGVAYDIAGEEFQKALENASLIYEMFAVNNYSGETININIENTSSIGVLYTEKTYLESQLESTKRVFSQVEGVSNVDIKLITLNFAGASHYAMEITCDIDGNIFKAYTITVQKGMRFANISIFSDNPDEMLSYFHAI